MTEYTVYFDRLDIYRMMALKEIAGGEMGWIETFPRLSEAKRIKFGRIAFGAPVKNVRIEYERNVATGYNIPVIYAEPDDASRNLPRSRKAG